ncbi:unnamed protein product [Durusdinium trenchii]|uniref:Uncharacterized protein n=1 Tax=Durusdinium trenchii TaxID=1381693 RepID=A0ABP0HNW6_9DINO
MTKPQGEWDIDWSWSCSLEDFREYDPDVQIGSPRSVAACDAQGIRPRELAYKPLEVFQLPGLDPRVAQLRYEFMEARRQDLLKAARDTRNIIIELVEEADREEAKAQESKHSARKKHWQQAAMAEDRSTKDDLHRELQPSWRDGGPPDPSLSGPPTTPYPVALNFFKEVFEEFSASRAMERPASSQDAEGQVLLPPVTPPSSSSSPVIKQLRPSPKRATSETQLRDLIHKMKTVPNGNHVDEEFARKSHELHLTYPKLEARWRQNVYKEQLRMQKSLTHMATDCFDRLIIEEEEKYEASKLREAMHQLSQEDDPTREQKKTPSFTPLSTTARSSHGFSSTMRSASSSRASHADREDAARDKTLGTLRENEIKRNETLQKKLEHQQEVQERVVEQATAVKWRMAYKVLEERLRWRLKYNQVEAKMQERERQTMEAFEQRQEYLRQRQARCDDSGEIRKELRHLRDVGRRLNQAQRERKEAWRLAKKKRESMEKHLAHCGLKMPNMPNVKS